VLYREVANREVTDPVSVGLRQGLLNLSFFIESEYTPVALTCTQIGVFDDIMYLDSDLTSSVGFRISIIFGYVIAPISIIICVPRVSIFRPRSLLRK